MRLVEVIVNLSDSKPMSQNRVPAGMEDMDKAINLCRSDSGDNSGHRWRGIGCRDKDEPEEVRRVALGDSK